jgi:hypothetical protein
MMVMPAVSSRLFFALVAIDSQGSVLFLHRPGDAMRHSYPASIG